MYKSQASSVLKKNNSKLPQITIQIPSDNALNTSLRDISRIDHDEKDGANEHLSFELTRSRDFESDTESPTLKKHSTILKLREKMRNLQIENKNYEGVLDTQNSAFKMMTLTNEKLSLEIKEWETKYANTKYEHERLEDLRYKDKLKIDAVVTFCKFIESCNFSAPEFTNKLIEFPSVIVSFLSGQRDQLSFFNPSSEKKNIDTSDILADLNSGSTVSTNVHPPIHNKPIGKISEFNNELSEIKLIVNNIQQSIGQSSSTRNTDTKSKSFRFDEDSPSVMGRPGSRVRFNVPSTPPSSPIKKDHTPSDDSTRDISQTLNKKMSIAFLKRAVWNSSNLLASISGRNLAHEKEMRKTFVLENQQNKIDH
eukprot:TRINITY_DN9287_c0_g1_i4.p1 TRINITY_DN9287_c0_g1~~TRINITY_DN9287_c0_g1_i4.p1  ORF type:complete len:367 (+),score=53.07 TRINITY_DN9287_c0_g1_i4:717-1817(+)